MSIPIWFLDIDGVINSVGPPLPDSGVDPSAYKLVEVPAGPPGDEIVWPINYSTKVVDFINEVSRAGLAEIHWLTTWEHQAQTKFAPAVGLDKFPAFAMPQDDSVSYDPDDAAPGQKWWKESVARAALRANNCPFVWTEDDLEESVRESMIADFPRDSLMIRPSFNPGLTNEHLDEIRRFLEKVANTRRDSQNQGRI